MREQTSKRTERFEGGRRPVSDERGIALFMVLWVLALLAVIVGEFCHGMKTEVNITRNFKEETEAYYIAEAGVFRALSELVKDIVMMPKAPESEEQEEEENTWRANAEIPAVPFGRGKYKVHIDDESGRINLNSADSKFLEVCLNGFGLSEEDMAVIIDSIQDWRDEDDEHRINGAETDYYQSLENPYECKNGDFDAVEELLLVRGVTPEIFYGGLKDRVTVYDEGSRARTSRNWRLMRYRTNKININAAPPEVLLSLPLMTQELVSGIVEFRKTADIASVSDLVSIVGMDAYNAIQTYITFSDGSFYRVRSTGMPDGSRTRSSIEVLAEINGAHDQGYRIIEWMEGADAFEDPAGGASADAGAEER